MKTKLQSLFIGLALIACAHQTVAQVTNLGIAPMAGGQSLLYWPVSMTNYVLQTVTNLASTNWVTARTAFAVIDKKLVFGIRMYFWHSNVLSAPRVRPAIVGEAVAGDDQAGAVLAVLAVDVGAGGDGEEGEINRSAECGVRSAESQLLGQSDGVSTHGHVGGQCGSFAGLGLSVELDDVRDPKHLQIEPALGAGLAAAIDGTGGIDGGEMGEGRGAAEKQYAESRKQK